MDNKNYRLQNHSTYKTSKKKYRSYNILNRDNMLVVFVIAYSKLNAIELGRQYFGCSNIRVIQ